MAERKRLLMLTSQHNPFDGRIFHLEAKALRDDGYDVFIAAEKRENYPSVVDGIRIISYRKAQGVLRKWSTLKALSLIALHTKPDIIHVHEVDAPLIAASWAKRKLKNMGIGVKLVFDSHEVWPFFYAGKTGNPVLQTLIKHAVILYENLMISRFIDGIITAHELEKYYYKFLNPSVPVVKVIGGPPIDLWGEPPKRSGEIKIIGHDGYFTDSRGMKTILGSFELIASNHPEVNLLIAGGFRYPEDEQYFEQWCERTRLTDRVIFTGWVNRDEVMQYLDRMDIGIVANNPDIHSIRCWPANKMMYYMARAVAVVSTPAPLYKENIARIGCGLVADSFTNKDVAVALDKLISDPSRTRKMGKNGYKSAKIEYNGNKATEELLNFYAELNRR
ncbi:glycosyltransferase family 4 protein [Calditrichota bacterium]